MRFPIIRRGINKAARIRSALFAKRRAIIENTRPIVSFTFDDFPLTAAQQGAQILSTYSSVGTFYISMGLIGMDCPTGRICGNEDVVRLIYTGHDIGCHTFNHVNAWSTPNSIFEKELEHNAIAIQQILPEFRFRTLSYPISCPHPANKTSAGRRFQAARGGGQKFNHGIVDLNCLQSFFLEKVHGDFCPVKEIIDKNNASNGWLIFSTHDISETPTQYGCTPAFFDTVVRYARETRSEILTVAAALDRCLKT